MGCGMFRYSHYGSNHLSTNRNGDALWYLQVFSLRFESPFDKEKRRCIVLSSGIFTTVGITFRQRETEMRYGIFWYSHYGSNNLSITTNRDALLYLQLFSLRFESPFDKVKRRCVLISSGDTRRRYVVFRYSYRHLNNLLQRKMRTRYVVFRSSHQYLNVFDIKKR